MGKDIVEQFGSITELMKTLGERKENNAAMKGKHSENDNDVSFYGTKTYKEAVDLLENGWTEKLEEVKEKFNAAARANASTSVERVRPSTGVVGYAPCVPNAIRGLPNSMITSERVPNKVKAVSVVYGTTVASSWTTNEMIKCGIAVLKLVNSLELEGYRVKLVLEAFSAEKNSSSATMLVDVKDYRQQIDLKKLCFPIIHPAMFRRICFKWLETVPNLTERGFSYGYGTPLTSEYQKHSKELKDRFKVLGENDYYISAYMVKSNGYDIEKIMKEAGMSQLRKG